MGNMVNITFLTDAMNEINENPIDWWNKIYNGINSKKNRKIHEYETTVNSLEHSDITTVLAVGGNHTMVLGYSSNPHYKEEDQIKILNELADKLGYFLVEKNKGKNNV